MSSRTLQSPGRTTNAGERLLAEYAHLAALLAREREFVDEPAEIWGDDASLEMQQLEVTYRHQEALARRMRRVEEALERLDSGDYGRCQRCSSLISRKRLDADPAVPFCVTCQESVEMDFHLWSL